MYSTILHPGLSIPAVPASDRDTHPAGMDLVQLRRFQWAVRAALVLGVAASMSANILHARDNPIAQTIAAWPPLALMLTVELISRVPIYRRPLAAVRLLATASIAGIAAYVSYFHMAAVVAEFGEHQPNPYLLPVSVDGLIVVASVSLVELAGRVRTIRNELSPAHRACSAPADPTPPPEVETQSVEDRAATRATETSATDSAITPHVAPPSATARPPAPPDTPPAEPPIQPFSSGQPLADEPEDSNKGQGDAIDPELAALLPAARAARNTLRDQHRGLTRDALAAQLRRDGYTIRTSRVSALLTLLRNDTLTTTTARIPGRPGAEADAFGHSDSSVAAA